MEAAKRELSIMVIYNDITKTFKKNRNYYQDIKTLYN